jgi:transcriptional regulator with XRE-family HTH domain
MARRAPRRSTRRSRLDENGVNAAGYEQLADLTGVSDRTLREVAHGERSLVLYETADAICVGLDTPLALLYPDL